MSLLRDIELVLRNKSKHSVDLTRVLSFGLTLFECLQHIHLSLRQILSM